MRNNAPTQNKLFLRPSLSAKNPPNAAPTTVPYSAIDTASPCVMLSRFQSFWMVCSAPEITAVSSPKRKPLRATVNDQRRSLCLFIDCAFLSFPDRLPLRIVMALRVCCQRKASRDALGGKQADLHQSRRWRHGQPSALHIFGWDAGAVKRLFAIRRRWTAHIAFHVRQPRATRT